MTFSTGLVSGLVSQIFLDPSPVAGVGTGLAAGVTLDTDIPFRMAGLAGLEVAPCFGRMLMQSRGVPLAVRTEHQVRLDPQLSFGEAIVAGGAELLVVTAVASLRVVLGLNWVNGNEVAPVALGHIVAPEGVRRQIGVDPSTLVAIETERLLVALGTVVGRLLDKRPVVLEPVTAMIGGNPFCLVTIIAFGDLHVGIFFVLLFLGYGLLHIQGRHYQKQTGEKQFLHSAPPF